MSNFIPAYGYIEVEPMESEGVLVSEEKKWVEKAKVLQIGNGTQDWPSPIEVGDIVYFRPHGFFELAEHNGERRYVVRVSPEFILGIYKNEQEKSPVAE